MSGLSAADVEAAVLGGAIAWFDHNQAARKDSGRSAPGGGPWRWARVVAPKNAGTRRYIPVAAGGSNNRSHHVRHSARSRCVRHL